MSNKKKETLLMCNKLWEVAMLWFKFVLGLNLIPFCPKLIIVHYHIQKQKKIKFKPGIKLNHHSYIYSLSKN